MQKKNSRELCWYVMMELVRGAVLGNRPQLQEGISIDWDLLMDVASEQSVIPWVWDGINKLPKEQHPSRLHKINWGLSAQEAEYRYHQQKDVLSQMINICNQNGMRLLLLKGIGLSELYPKPSLRTCNDIDIFLFDDYEKGNLLFCNGDYTFGEGDKHANFKYKGITVENHLTIINTNTRQQRLAESYIESTLHEVELTKDGYYILPPIGNLVFLLMHFLSHMESPIYPTIRNIVDFSMVLLKNGSRINPNECKRVLHHLKISKPFELLLSMSEHVLGVDFKDYHEGVIPKQDVRKAFNMIAERDASIEVPYELPLFKQIKKRKEYYRRMKWKYNYIPFSHLNSFLRIYKPPISHAVKSIFKQLE